MLVGNDIVDLHDPWSQPENIHGRFDSRAFTGPERTQIGGSGSPHQFRWSLWAAKESAFKIARKLDRDVRFFPRDFAVRMLGDVRAEVTHQTGRFSVWFERADEWLHAVAVHETDHGSAADKPPVGVGSRVRRLTVTSLAEGEEGAPNEEMAGAAVRGASHRGASGRGASSCADRSSRRVREVARAAVGSLMKVCPSEIEVVSEAGIPTLHRRDERLSLDLSMSHDGRFVACAWAEAGGRAG